jgi:hypothetical protein
VRSYTDLDSISDNELSPPNESYGVRNFDKIDKIKAVQNQSTFKPSRKSAFSCTNGITPKAIPASLVNMHAMKFATELLSTEFPDVAQKLQNLQRFGSNVAQNYSSTQLFVDPKACNASKNLLSQEDLRRCNLERLQEEEQSCFKWPVSNDCMSSESSEEPSDRCMFKLDYKDDTLFHFEVNHEEDYNHLLLQRPLVNLMPNSSNNFEHHSSPKIDGSKYINPGSAHEECTSIKQLGEIFDQGKANIRPYLCTAPYYSNTGRQITSVSKNE